MTITEKPGRSLQGTLARAVLEALPTPVQMVILARELAFGPDDEGLLSAQDLVYDAWDERDGRRRYALARKALGTSPFCADAWSILAEQPSLSAQDRRAFLERALMAGELALGEGGFRRNKGSFWSALETRPYMRARHALAQDLWAAGNHDVAIAHLRDMLKLNPGDNQGLRYILLAWLLRRGDDAGVDALLRNHGDGSTFMRYTAALIAFRKSGDDASARRAVNAAWGSNSHVPRLLGHDRFRHKDSGYYSPGREDEAGYYVQEYGFAWRAQAGALEWLLQITQEMKPQAARRSL